MGRNGRQTRRRLPWLALILLPSASAAAQPPQRAADFIANIAHYVYWPAKSLPEADTPLSLCLTGGSGPVGRVLRGLRDRRAQSRELRVRLAEGPAELKGCHMVFFEAGTEPASAALLHSLRRAPVLTVSDTPGFAQRGGMIGLVHEGEHLRFRINLDAVKQAQLKLSARLLAVTRGAP